VLQELTAENSDSVPEIEVSNPVPVVRLVHSYRQKISDPAGRNILGVASTVKEMELNPRPELFFETESPNHEIIRRLNGLEDAESEKVMLLNQPNSPNQLLEFAQWWVKRFLQDEKFMFLVQQEYLLDAVESAVSQLDYLFNYLKRFRILTATQVLSTGAEALNQMILKCWLAENGTKHLFSEHYPGEPVMVSENNYQHKLFNGDQGIFLKFIHPVTKKVELKAVFPVEEEHKTFYVHELHHLHPAYATSVHKSQGSEYDHLALILPAFTKVGVNSESEKGTQRELMSREMLYTALTRAKKSVLIMGDQRVLESAAMHKVLRYSGLGAALRSKNI
jgi:exodeoxyribonuclease V alpha subunit